MPKYHSGRLLILRLKCRSIALLSRCQRSGLLYDCPVSVHLAESRSSAIAYERLLRGKQAFRIERRHIDVSSHPDYPPTQSSRTALNNLVPRKKPLPREVAAVVLLGRLGRRGQKKESLRPITIPPPLSGVFLWLMQRYILSVS